MERRGTNTWLVAVLAVAVGFLAALLIFGGDDNKNTSAVVSGTATTASATTGATTAGTQAGTTTTTATATTGQSATPQTPERTVGSCIALWNQPNNRGNQTFLVNVFSHSAIRVHVRPTDEVPPKCEVAVVTNAGDAYVFPEGGGTTFPYAIAPGKTESSSLAPEQKISNALEQSDGTLKPR